MSSLIDDLVVRADFRHGDFLRTRKRAVGDVGDVREILKMYLKELSGDVSRKKFWKTKIQKVEHSLTPSGVKKLNDARKTLRMNVEASRKKVQRAEKLPPVQRDDDYGFDDGPDVFIRKMQRWGEFPVEDRRYYLHVVFRYYFKEYHDHAVSAGVVVPHPSYQYILDALFPNGCANRFPPEFRRFLVDSSGRSITTVSLPVPLKGSSQEVTYVYNFEAIPNVSTLRRKIEAIVLDWKCRVQEYRVYPPYLCKGSPHNELIVEAECSARKVGIVKEGLKRLSCVNEEKLAAVAKEVPACLTAYDDYTAHVFKTGGEQLNERMGFFMRSTYRKIFFNLKDLDIMEDLFVASGAGMEVFVCFQSFCTKEFRGSMGFEKNESLCRALLMLIVDICFFFHAFDNRALAAEEPSKIIAKVVREIEDSCG